MPFDSCPARLASGDSIRWFGPEREGDRRALERWCGTVGPPIVVPEPSRSFAPPAAGDSLVVVTWNAHVGAGNLEALLGAELGYRCTAEPGKGPARHFVLLVQEVFRAGDEVPVASGRAPVPGRIGAGSEAGGRLEIGEVASRCGLALFYTPSMRNGREAGPGGREDRGSAVLSSLPLADLVAIELPLEAQRRVVPVATVAGPGGEPLRVASVHLDVAGNILRVLGTGGSLRVRQAAGLQQVLDRLDGAGEVPTVVAGDLNTWSERETVILRMLAAYPDSPRPGREGTRSGWPADHVFYRKGTGDLRVVEGSYAVVTSSYGSDHRPRRLALRR